MLNGELKKAAETQASDPDQLPKSPQQEDGRGGGGRGARWRWALGMKASKQAETEASFFGLYLSFNFCIETKHITTGGSDKIQAETDELV